MEPLFKELLNELGSPITFGDVLLSTKIPDEQIADDLVSMLVLELMDNSVRNKLNFTGVIQLNFLMQCHNVEQLKLITTNDWVSLSKRLDRVTIEENEKMLLQCAIGLVNSKYHSLACKLFSIYLLDTM